MKARRRLARLTRAMRRILDLARAAGGPDWSHCHLVCVVAELGDVARRALQKPARAPRRPTAAA